MSNGDAGSSGTERQAGIRLGAESYTANRLQHASAQHLYVTSRRCFVGPIPQDWLKRKDHRRAWFNHSLNFSSYSSKAVTFSAGSDVSNRRQTTGIDAAPGPATHGQSFPQPNDVNDGSNNATNSPDINSDVHISPERYSARLQIPDQSSPSSLQTIDNQRRRKTGQSELAPSSVTAPETKLSPSAISPKNSFPSVIETGGEAAKDVGPSRISTNSSVAAVSSLNWEAAGAGDPNNSTSSLLHAGPSDAKAFPLSNDDARGRNTSAESPAGTTKISSVVERSHSTKTAEQPMELQNVDPESFVDSSPTDVTEMRRMNPVSTGLVRFDLPDQLTAEEQWVKSEADDLFERNRFSQWRRPKSKPGLMIKSEKMLVRVDYTRGQLLPDYDENASLGSETRTIEKWRELIVVCRKTTDQNAEFVIQLYKTRVIPAIEQADGKKRWAYEIPLVRKITNLNLYSSLDKTIVLWTTYKKGTRIFILRPRSSASSVEWYTFLRSSLGWKRSSSLRVNVPDLNVTLQLTNPFEEPVVPDSVIEDARKDPNTMMSLVDSKRTIASTIVRRCMEMLAKSPEWSNVTDAWLRQEKMGLAWKRYDRLEWVHGINEQKMYGTIAMERSHDLELRPKQHYPTTVTPSGQDTLEEPPPVEGFLIRLTSQKGREKRFGKMFSKRSYFSTHNQYLCYCRPSKAMVPAPPELPKAQGENIPNLDQIAEKIPLIYAVNPFPIQNAQIQWLATKDTRSPEEHDQYAFEETERKIHTLIETDGYINLCSVVDVRDVSKIGPVIPTQTQASNLTKDSSIFELSLKNGLIVRLKAYDEATKTEWISRITRLSNYWKLRIANDMDIHKSVRKANLDTLNIDEEMESFIGQYARKWEVTRSVASSRLFNMCGISCCRSITMAGSLYRKPRLHSTFKRCSIILCHGRLMVFEETVRKQSGKEIPHVLHERQDTLELKDTYIYSGLITEGDLLYQNQTFDSNHPGHHALPRVYIQDSWTSSDEDTTTCFVIWYSKSRSLFMANAEPGGGRTRRSLRYVSRLGVTGRSMVFKARSRAERDHWVMNIGMEIERLQEAEEIRVISKK